MRDFLSDNQQAHYAAFRTFVSQHIEPQAETWDRDQHIPARAIAQMGESGYLGGHLPKRYGGREWDLITFGLLNEALGRGMSALADLLTVQAMVSMTLLKWGTEEQKNRWLPPLAAGKLVGAFALTEPSGGSALESLQTEFRKGATPGSFRLNGEKSWISFGQTAGLFLVVGHWESRPLACLVPREAAGLEVTAISDLMGFRAAGLARLSFRDVEIPAENLIAKPGSALSFVVPVGLHYGRISTACSALGLLRGCFEESVAFAARRRIGQARAGDFGMIRSLLARMGTNLQAAQWLCYEACWSAQHRQPEAFTKALSAKYFASKSAACAAADAVQIQGAAGCRDATPVARYYRDAKIMEIIEGTSQVHEQLLGKSFLDAAPKDENNGFIQSSRMEFAN